MKKFLVYLDDTPYIKTLKYKAVLTAIRAEIESKLSKKVR